MGPSNIWNLNMFVAISKVFWLFLEVFQPNDPMLPFMAKELQLILCTLLGYFIKDDLIDEATSPFKVSSRQVQICDEQNVFPPKGINIPFSVKDFVWVGKKVLSSWQYLECNNEWSVFIRTAASKLLKWSPLQYLVVVVWSTLTNDILHKISVQH